MLRRIVSGIWCVMLVMLAQGAVYEGRVVNEHGEGLMYASVYPEQSPMDGTATNTKGWFSLEFRGESLENRGESLELREGILVVSSIGYQTVRLPMATWQNGTEVVLKEQPVVLETMTVNAAKTRQSKRKKIATILHAVYEQMARQTPPTPVRYHIVSDIKMDASASSWGMEQMMATIIQIPATDVSRTDSVQFTGTYCKRYCDPRVRTHVDSLLYQEKDKHRKRFAIALDSGTVVHRKMWEMSQIERGMLLDISDELGRWTMTPQDDGKCLQLSYKRKSSKYLGVVQIEEKHNLLVDNNAVLHTCINELKIHIFLPFSIKIKDSDMSWLNLLNMDEERLEKFRLKKADMHVVFQTDYTEQGEWILPNEKTMHVTAQLEDNKKNILPCEVWAGQRVSEAETEGVRPLTRYNKNRKVARVLVPIY